VSSSDEVRRNARYDARTLSILVSAQVDVSVGTSDKMVVRMTGPSDRVDEVLVLEQDGVLLITGCATPRPTATDVIAGCVSGTVIRLGDVSAILTFDVTGAFLDASRPGPATADWAGVRIEVEFPRPASRQCPWVDEGATASSTP
jgi:hypothetical protein